VALRRLGGVSEPAPREGEIHPLGMKQGQPVFYERRIGVVVVRFASTQPELGKFMETIRLGLSSESSGEDDQKIVPGQLSGRYQRAVSQAVSR
jgi:hypothetical protein